MVEINSICGKWKLNDKSQWEFEVDNNRMGSLSEIDENVTYENLVKIIIEDFDIQDQDIALSYGLPLSMKSKIQNSPPVDIRNDRQLRVFINKIKKGYELVTLCVTLSDKPVSNFSRFVCKFW